MIAGIFLATLMCQQMDITRPFDEFLAKEQAIAKAKSRHEKQVIDQERAEFANRYNDLVKALQTFEAEYKKSDGLVWPVKAASEVSKAMRKLESTTAWKQYNDSRKKDEIARK